MSNKNISSAALTKEQLFQEWKEVRSEGLSYARAGIDDAMSDEVYAKGQTLYRRKKEIESILNSMGYDIVDGENPYSFHLAKIGT